MTRRRCIARPNSQGFSNRGLDIYIGPCQVIHVDVDQGARIEPAHIDQPIEMERVLLATGSFPCREDHQPVRDSVQQNLC